MTRPDWAAGAEWEGWECFTDEDGNPGVFRAPKNRHQFRVMGDWSEYKDLNELPPTHYLDPLPALPTAATAEAEDGK